MINRYGTWLIAFCREELLCFIGSFPVVKSTDNRKSFKICA